MLGQRVNPGLPRSSQGCATGSAPASGGHDEDRPPRRDKGRFGIQGEFVWHTHEDTDELFLVVGGALTIQLRDENVTLKPGQLFVVPKGVQHCPIADGEVHALLIEPVGVINTGAAGGTLTAAYDDSLT